ncbi:MAG: T9SS type A sorting domain-containing protein [Chryseosolibacter sp.]
MRQLYLIVLLLLVLKSATAQFITNTGIAIKNSALVATNGAWTNDAATIILNNGTIHTTESFVNNGKLDPASKGGFVLDFPIDLSFQPGGSLMGFLTKAGPGTALVAGTIGVKDTLNLKGGLIRLMNTNDTVSLEAGAVLFASPTSYVEGGFIARGGTGDLVFPFGKDGLYLPLKIYKVQAKKITALLTDAPAGHTAGPGVDALIGFPYAWKVVEKIAADTAGYIEMNYPSTLPVVSNPIVAREVPGAQYASMGARLINNDGARMTVKSYSRRLTGLFTVAQGFPSDPVTDSLALVALYNSTGGPAWTNRGNWLSGTIDTWFGVTVNGQSITSVELPNNNLKGPVADPLVDILSLQTINLSANDITALPDFTLNPEVTSLNVSDNNLDFASLEPNAGVVGINYFIQGPLGTALDTTIAVGTPHAFAVSAGGASSQYQWKRNSVPVSGATSALYTLPAISRQTMGEYVVEVTNPNLPGLLLKSAPQKVLAYANVAGKLFADQDVPAEQGELTLYKVQPGAFEPVATIPVQSDGTYSFEEVILDDYQIRGFADTLVHPRALPTYYENTIFWEEADTLNLENNIDTLDIVSQVEPGPPSGRGSISGYLQEDDGTGRTQDIEKNKRIAQAGVSARRVERTGRTKGEILTLVAYVFTDENGEFNLPNLPTGEYRINFQYPGYPMDEASFTTVNIGTAFESQVMVEANVLDGKINVRKLVITGLYETEEYSAEVFPNPAVDHLRLKFGAEVKGRMVTLSDMQGKAVHSLPAEQKEAVVDLKHFQSGLYILKIKENGINVKTLKISIE